MAIPRAHVHLAIWALLLVHMQLAKIGWMAPEDMLRAIASTNLITLGAYLVIFHLLTDQSDTRPATRADFICLALCVLAVWSTSIFGVTYDVAFLQGLVAVFYLRRRGMHQSFAFIAAVYGALAINGLVAPVIFQLFKDWFLIGEAQFAATVIQLAGRDVMIEGTRIIAEDGMRLQLIGACSVFTNISYAVLGYTSIKAMVRSGLAAWDLLVLAVIAAALIIANAIRLGLMTPSEAAYTFWHHGDGALVFVWVQFALIAGLSLGAMYWKRPQWRV